MSALKYSLEIMIQVATVAAAGCVGLIALSLGSSSDEQQRRASLARSNTLLKLAGFMGSGGSLVAALVSLYRCQEAYDNLNSEQSQLYFMATLCSLVLVVAFHCGVRSIIRKRANP